MEPDHAKSRDDVQFGWIRFFPVPAAVFPLPVSTLLPKGLPGDSVPSFH
jgi:hypothetical protein